MTGGAAGSPGQPGGQGPGAAGVTARIGIETELLAPPGASRFALAEALAGGLGGGVRAAFHRDSEPSTNKRYRLFHHLSQASVVVDGQGRARCHLVDDTTIRDELDRDAAPLPGRYRVISDDVRLVRLAHRICDPAAPVEGVLEPLAEAFGTGVEQVSGGRYRVDDEAGITVGMAVPQGGERERVCELVTSVIDGDHARNLAALLEPARRAGFTVPVEAAVHVHFDAEPFRNGPRLAHLVRLFTERRTWLWEHFGTNPRCRRLAPVPDPLVELVARPGFEAWPWERIEAELTKLGLSKYHDVNLANMVRRTRGKDTVEIRILPGSVDAEEIIAQVASLEQLLFRS